MLRIHVLQQWFGLSDPAMEVVMEVALHDTPLYCGFVGLDAGMTRLPDETTILRMRPPSCGFIICSNSTT